MSDADVLHGDCLDVMPTLDAESVDAIVCDPPAGISFMSKAWDDDKGGRDQWIAWLASVMRECLRVLKPGGHALVWALPRTSHWTGMALENAGFEVRDQVLHLVGSGFPKSLNVNKDARFCQCDALPYSHANTSQGMREVREGVDAENALPDGAESVLLDGVLSLGASVPPQKGTAGNGVRRVRQAHSPMPEPVAAPGGGVLQWHLPEQDVRGSVQANCRARPSGLDGSESSGCVGQDERSGKPRVEGGRDLLQEEGQLQGHSLRPRAGVGAADGPEGRLHHGAPSRNGRDGGPTPDADRGSTSPQPRPHGQPAGESGTLADERLPQERGAWPACDGCGKPRIPPGLGTALKPAQEIWWLARKPLRGTVAANVAAFGCGALNVDACRIGHSDDLSRYDRSATSAMGYHGVSEPKLTPAHAAGRWPANVVLDESAAALLDAQSGERMHGAGHATRSAKRGRSEMFGIDAQDGAHRFGDTGGASRFFYTAKASRREREAGLEGMPKRAAGVHDDDGHRQPGERKNNHTAPMPAANAHPTVKPLALMRWLCRLVCPPGGLILDPFAGSGSTGCAAVLEGFRFLGIEQSEEYVAIARRRIAHWTDEAPDLQPQLEIA